MPCATYRDLIVAYSCIMQISSSRKGVLFLIRKEFFLYSLCATCNVSLRTLFARVSLHLFSLWKDTCRWNVLRLFLRMYKRAFPKFFLFNLSKILKKSVRFFFPLSYFNEQSINRYTLSMLKLAILINCSFTFTTRSLIPKFKVCVVQRYYYALNYIAWVYNSFENIALQNQQCNRYSAITTHYERYLNIDGAFIRVTTLYTLQIGSIFLPEFFPFYYSFTPCIIHAGI